jgi:hypothetical protein
MNLTKILHQPYKKRNTTSPQKSSIFAFSFNLMAVVRYLWYDKNIKVIRKTIGRWNSMPTNEKEINCQLFDQLSILERIEAVTDDEKALKQIAIEKRQIMRKLYQELPKAE